MSMCVKSREVIKQFPPNIFIHLFAQSMRHHKKVMLMLMSVHTSQSGEREIQGEKFEKQIKKSSKCLQHVLCIFIIHTQVLHMTCTLLLGGSRYSHYFLLLYVD